MKSIFALVGIFIAVGSAGSAMAEPIVYQIELIPEKSLAICGRFTGYYTIDIQSGVFSIYSSRPPAADLARPLFTLAIPPDGKFKRQFRHPEGGSLEFIANVSQEEYQFHNQSTSCWYKLNNWKPEFKP